MSLNKITTSDVNDDFKNILTNVSTGNISATNANKLTTARNINLIGDITGSAVFDGSSDISITTVEKASGVTAGTYTKVTVDSKGNVTVGASATATDVGLGNVTNESKATMFTSPTFTGTPLAPTATAGTNTTQIATTSFVANAVNAMQIGGRNLILNSDFSKASLPSGCTLSNGQVTFTSSTLNQTIQVLLNISDMIKSLPAGSQITGSMLCSLTNIVAGTTNFWLGAEMSVTYSDSTQAWFDIGGGSNLGTGTKTEFKQINTYTLKSGVKVTSAVVAFLIRDCTGTVTMRYPKFEQGNQETDYTPAPEDIQTQLDGKALAVHTHDDRYYTETEMNNKLSVLGSFVYGATLPDVSLRNANSLYFKITG